MPVKMGGYKILLVPMQVSPLLDSSLPAAVRQEEGVGAGGAAAGGIARTHSRPGELPQAASSPAQLLLLFILHKQLLKVIKERFLLIGLAAKADVSVRSNEVQGRACSPITSMQDVLWIKQY
jgi:hypothetical protein